MFIEYECFHFYKYSAKSSVYTNMFTLTVCMCLFGLDLKNIDYNCNVLYLVRRSQRVRLRNPR